MKRGEDCVHENWLVWCPRPINLASVCGNLHHSSGDLEAALFVSRNTFGRRFLVTWQWCFSFFVFWGSAFNVHFLCWLFSRPLLLEDGLFSFFKFFYVISCFVSVCLVLVCVSNSNRALCFIHSRLHPMLDERTHFGGRQRVLLRKIERKISARFSVWQKRMLSIRVQCGKLYNRIDFNVALAVSGEIFNVIDCITSRRV